MVYCYVIINKYLVTKVMLSRAGNPVWLHVMTSDPRVGWSNEYCGSTRSPGILYGSLHWNGSQDNNYNVLAVFVFLVWRSKDTAQYGISVTKVLDTFYTYTVSVLRSKMLQSFVATVNQLSKATVVIDSHDPIL